MESTNRLVRTYMASSGDKELEDLVSGIRDGQITMLKLIQSLGEYLTSTEDDDRSKGMALLSDVLGRCPPEKINRQSTHVLTTFCCGKLDDVDTVNSALKGIASLADLPTFSGDDAIAVVEALFAHITMKSHIQSIRYIVFKIIDVILARHRDVLKAMGSAFVASYVQLVEGEKDPRNLLVSFSIIRVLLIEFDVASQIENLFDITFCYFPITFKPPPNDPYGITSEDLKVALRSCLNATPLFGPLALPMFLEKLTASAGNLKKDTLQTVSSCLPVYGPGIARSYSTKLWESFKIEIFQPADVETEGNALQAAQSLIKTIYPPVQDTEEQTAFDGLIVDIVQECKAILRESEKKQAQHAIKVLGACVSTTPAIRSYALSQAVPHLIGLYLNPDEISYRAPILAGLTGLLMAVRDAAAQGVIAVSEQPLEPYKDQLLGAFSSGIKATASRRPALEGFLQLVKSPQLLTPEELGFTVLGINELLDTKSTIDLDDLRPNALEVLTAVSEIFPKPIEETTLPPLFASLPSFGPARTATVEQENYRETLSTLATLCLQPILFETLVIRLTTRLDILCSDSSPESREDDIECDTAYAFAILNTLQEALVAKAAAQHVDIPKYIDRLVPSIYTLFIRASTAPAENGGRGQVVGDSRLVKVAADIISSVTRSLTLERQNGFAIALFAALESGVTTPLLGGRKLANNVPFSPFKSGVSALQKDIIPLFTAPIIAFRKEVALPPQDLPQYLTLLLKWTLDKATTEAQVIGVLHALASIVNKRAEDLSDFLSSTLSAHWDNEIATGDIASIRRRRALLAWIWITKALLVRSHPLGATLVDKLFAAFSDREIGWDAAKGVGELGKGGEDVLTKGNFAVIRILHAQKFLSAVMPRIINGCKSSEDPEQQTTFLVALTSLIKSVPKATYAHELSGMMPLLLRSLDLPDLEMRANVIDTLLSIAQDESSDENAGKSGVISEHASTIVGALLKNCSIENAASPRLRRAALKCLGALPAAVRYDILHPQKPVVITRLAATLDDPKRSVRKEAVDARSNWFLYHG